MIHVRLTVLLKFYNNQLGTTAQVYSRHAMVVKAVPSKPLTQNVPNIFRQIQHHMQCHISLVFEKKVLTIINIGKQTLRKEIHKDMLGTSKRNVIYAAGNCFSGWQFSSSVCRVQTRSKQNGSSQKLGTLCSARLTLMSWFHLEHAVRSSPPHSAENETLLHTTNTIVQVQAHLMNQNVILHVNLSQPSTIYLLMVTNKDSAP